jgi:hypothetical protein
VPCRPIHSRHRQSRNEQWRGPCYWILTDRVCRERVVHAKGGGAHGVFEVTHDISDLTLATDSRETSSGAGLVSDLAEELGAGEVGDVVGVGWQKGIGDRYWILTDRVCRERVVHAKGGGAHGEQVDQVEVLEEERSVRAGTLSSVRLLNGSALRRGLKMPSQEVFQKVSSPVYRDEDELD